MGARTFRALSRDPHGSNLVCRHDLREHKESHIVVERDARGGWQRPYICIELLALLTLCRRGKGFNLVHEPLQHCWLHPVSPHGLITPQKRSRSIHDPVNCASCATRGATVSTVMATVPQPTRVSSHILWSCAQNPATKSMSSRIRSSSDSSICSCRIFSRVT